MLSTRWGPFRLTPSANPWASKRDSQRSCSKGSGKGCSKGSGRGGRWGVRRGGRWGGRRGGGRGDDRRWQAQVLARLKLHPNCLQVWRSGQRPVRGLLSPPWRWRLSPLGVPRRPL